MTPREREQELMTGRIDIRDGALYIRELEIRDREVVDFIGLLPDEGRVSGLTQALQVGVFCLERAQANHDTEFVRRQVESLLTDVTRAVEKIPDVAEQALIKRIGTENGQVLAPIYHLVTEVSRTTTTRLSEVRDLLAREIDPAKDSSTLGRVLRNLRDLLDPNRTDSVQGCIQAAVSQVTGENGTLAKAIKSVVSEAMQPFHNQLTALAMEVRGRDATAEVLSQTTAKGLSYEDEVTDHLQRWAQAVGVEVHHVGLDNQPGDVLVRVGPNSLPVNPFTIVIEVRDRQSAVGRKAINDMLAKAMDVRGATAGIHVSKTRDGLAQEIGEWAEGACDRGYWVACTHEHLFTAIRFLIVQERLKDLREATADIDCASIEAQVQRIRTSLERVKKISRRVGDVRLSADEIQQEAEVLRDEIKGALAFVEEAIRKQAAHFETE